MAQVTLDMSEFTAMKKRADDAEQHVAELQKQIVALKFEKSDGGMAALTAAFRSGLDVARYAIGMLSPEFARKWPRTELIAMAEGIKLIPDATPYELELVPVIASFVRDVEKYDATRNNGYVPLPDEIAPKGDRHAVLAAEDLTPSP